MPEQRIHALMDELNTLLEERIQDEENKELLSDYRTSEGATDEELDAFEQELGIRLPADLRAFYKRKNGSGYAFHILYPTDPEGREDIPFYLLSLDRIRKEQSSLVESRLDNFYCPEELETNKPDPRIKPYLFQKNWITIGMLGGGSLYLMLDFDPTEQGTYGQIIMYKHDPDFVYYVTGTFTELLEQSNENLRAIEVIEY